MSLTLSEFEDSDIYDALKRAIAETQRPSENFTLIIGIFENIIIFITYAVIILSWNIWFMPILLVLPIFSFFVTYSMGKYEFQIKQERTMAAVGNYSLHVKGRKYI